MAEFRFISDRNSAIGAAAEWIRAPARGPR
jgi:hypothetical protein